jgi:hypothetical protein
MTVAFRHPPRHTPVAYPTASDHPADAQTRSEVIVPGLPAGARDGQWSFQRMIVMATAISVALWFGLGALIWKAISF